MFWELQVFPKVEAPLSPRNLDLSKGPPDSEVPHPAAHLDVPWTSAAFSPSSLVRMSFLDPSRE